MKDIITHLVLRFNIKSFCMLASIVSLIIFTGCTLDDIPPTSAYVEPEPPENCILLPAAPEIGSVVTDFDCETPTFSAFGNINGTYSVAVVDNPVSGGINTSIRVVEVAQGAAVEGWAGFSFPLAGKIDFSANRTVKMKVYSPAAEQVVLLKLEDKTSEGSIAKEVSAVTTVANEWEELSFIFAPSDHDKYDLGVLFFNFQGSSKAAPTTHYFDDIIVVEGDAAGPMVKLPVDFESSELTYNWLGFDGGTASVIDNPQTTGNSSAKVTELVKGTGQTWAGAVLTLGESIDFSSGEIFTMNFWSSSAKPVLLKFEGSLANDEMTANHGGGSAWESLTFDFTGKTAALGDVVKIVIIVDNGVAGDGTASSTYYLDDISHKAVELPVDFEETGLTYDWLGFDGGAATVIDNPQTTGNSSSKVTELVKGTGQTWAGAVLTLGESIDFSSGEVFTMNFWSASAKPVLLKFEGSLASDELTASHTGSSSWETLTFDFTGKTAALGEVVKLVIIVDNGVAGDGSAASTYYLDDIVQN